MVDVSALTPDLLAGKSREDLLRIELLSGNRRLRVEDLFDVSGDDGESNVTIRADTDRLACVGARMQSGSIVVEGDCGPYVGLGMRGGKIVVGGAAAAFVGCGMRGGAIEVRGDAGDFVGSALPGDKQGMRGGSIVIGGNAGDRVGDRMRRGMILIAGDAGAYCGSRMLAGTIVVSGRVGHSPGFALKRGTLVLAHPPAEMPATFQDSGEHELLFLALLAQHFEREGGPFKTFLPLSNRVRRYCGDLATGGKGEMLLSLSNRN
jgi:formylmethanofuran dehydrogenase subunit C